MNERSRNENRYSKRKYIKQAQTQTRNEYDTLSRKYSTAQCSYSLHVFIYAQFGYIYLICLSSGFKSFEMVYQAYIVSENKIPLKYLLTISYKT